MTEAIARHNLLGVEVSAVDLDQATDAIFNAALDHRPYGVSALAVHGLMLARDDPTLQYRLNALDMVVPDGQPLCWALNWLHGCELESKVPGPDLMMSLCTRASESGLGVYLYGSTGHTLERLRNRLQHTLPGLRIAGSQPSRFRSSTEEERQADIRRIHATSASMVFAGLGCPRQEIWTYENKRELSMPVMAVGAAFDYHAGLLRRAPGWMQRAGLEWAYRLAQEPDRLAGRYLRLNPRFLALLGRQKGRPDTFSSTDGVEPAAMVRPG